MRNTTKSHVIGTYSEVFKGEFLAPGTEKYMNSEILEERIAKADKLGLLDEPYVEHEFKYSKKSVEKRRRKQLERQQHRGRNMMFGFAGLTALSLCVLAVMILIYVILMAAFGLFMMFCVIAVLIWIF